jgi:ELWxxDGT repeat protein
MKIFLNLLAGVALIAVSAATAGAQVASLVEDIHPGSDAAFNAAVPLQLSAAGERLVFSAGIDNLDGDALWVSDGTAQGTEMVASLCPQCGSSPRLVGTTGKLSFWIMGESELWRSDGTREGTFPLVTGVSPLSIATHGDAVFFSGCPETDRCGLWRTDGTPAGTRQILNQRASRIVPAGNRLFLVINESLWKLEPGSETAVLVGHVGFIGGITVLQNRLLMLASNNLAQTELWVSDGTAAGTRPLTHFAKPDAFAGSGFVSSGRRIYFIVDEAEHDHELWASDGTPQGTKRITQFDNWYPFPVENALETLQEVGNRVLFAATEVEGTESGYQLWMTDGRPESTTQLAVPCPRGCGTERRGPAFQTARAGDLVLFTAEDESHGTELWATDGTPKGTRLFQDLCYGSCHSGVRLIHPDSSGKKIYFSALRHLWLSDGTAAGTRPLTRQPSEGYDFGTPQVLTVGGKTFVNPGETTSRSLLILKDEELAPLTFGSGRQGGSDPRNLFAMGGTVHFLADDGEWFKGLWQSSGSAQTTRLTSSLPNFVERFYSAGGVVYLFEDRYELWRITDDGVRFLADLDDDTGAASGTAGALGSRLYFDVVRGGVSEIWRTEGTEATTQSFLALPAELDVTFVTASAGRLYFGASHEDTNESELWTSDGTVAGTRKILTTSQGPIHGEIIRAGGADYFILGDGFTNDQLWKTGGTPETTVRVQISDRSVRLTEDWVAHEGSLYILGEEYHIPWVSTVWRVQGDSAVRLGTFGEHPREIPLQVEVAGDHVVFNVADPEHGVELWGTDGSVEGTRLLRDIAPGRISARVHGLASAGGRVFFAANDLIHGSEVWESDGTAAGTRLVHDVAPGPGSSHPQWLTAAEGKLYFSADDSLVGRELWMLPLAGPGGCQPTSTILCLQGGRFRVEAQWRDFQDHFGTGMAVPLTADTGYFWFFDPSNAEVILKVLDGRGLNGHHWVFYGALSNVEYSLTITDTQTGLTQRYLNPSGQLASVGDTTGFGPQGAFVPRREPLVALPSPAALVSARTEPAAATGSCQPGPRRLCVNDGRFAVEASWKDFQGNTGQGTAVPLTTDTGYFWFFDPSNVEVMLKVLDGTALNGKFWVFYGALSNVEYTLTVTDTQTGAVKVYSNPSGRFASVADTSAF